MSEAPLEAYPLTWPAGRRRTESYRRQAGQFANRGFALIRDELLAELGRLGARNVVVSSNLPTRRDGLPYADSREPADPGIAVYFRRKDKPYVLACDHYNKTWKNLRAIAATIEAMRTIERHGGTQMLEQAFTGFAALPAAREADPSWWEVLGVSPGASVGQIDDAFRELALKRHPDTGGTNEAMAQLLRARETALQERA